MNPELPFLIFYIDMRTKAGALKSAPTLFFLCLQTSLPSRFLILFIPRVYTKHLVFGIVLVGNPSVDIFYDVIRGQIEYRLFLSFFYNGKSHQIYPGAPPIAKGNCVLFLLVSVHIHLIRSNDLQRRQGMTVKLKRNLLFSVHNDIVILLPV